MVSSKSKRAPTMTADDKNAKMAEERAFLTKLLESALAGETSKVIEYTMEYSTKHSIPPYQVVSQFKDGSQRTALHFACQSKPSSQRDEKDDDIVVHLLTKSNFPPSAISALLRSTDKDGLTPLMLCCQTIHSSSLHRIECILQLTDETAASARSSAGATPLHYASAAGAPLPILTALHNSYPEAVRTKSERGGTPLHWASGSAPPARYVETLESLIDGCGADVNAPNEDGVSALVLAAAAGNDAHAKVLVEKGADRGVLLGGNVTVYHIAADLNLVGALAAMMEKDRMEGEERRKEGGETIGAKCLRMENHLGEKPLDLAVQEGHVGCVMLLTDQHDEAATKSYMEQEQQKASKKTSTTPQQPEIPEKPTPTQEFKSKIDSVGITETQAEKAATETVQSTPTITPDQKTQALQLKTLGNTHFSNKDYTNAIQQYTAALQLDPTDATFYSNRSACYMAIQDYDSALKDAVAVRVLRSDWTKGFYRLAVARLALERFDDAAHAAWGGLQLDHENDELKCLLQKCVKKGRKDHLEKNAEGRR